jgi:hypothetical protein
VIQFFEVFGGFMRWWHALPILSQATALGLEAVVVYWSLSKKDDK